MADDAYNKDGSCRSGTAGCTWSHHNYKHFPRKGITRGSTRKGPALYLERYSKDDIRALETATSRAPDVSGGGTDSRVNYVRDMSEVIGWDSGREATLSYVECSGGSRGGRAYHGRPMHIEHRAARALLRGVDQ